MLSAKHQTLIPRLTGFRVMNCFKQDLPSYNHFTWHPVTWLHSCTHAFYNWSSVKPYLPSFCQIGVFNKMKITWDFLESITADSAGYGFIVIKRILFPIIFNLWHCDKSHADIESKVSLQFLNIYWCPTLEFSWSISLACIEVCLLDNVCHQFICE